MANSTELGGFNRTEEIHIFDQQNIRLLLIIVYSVVFIFCFCGNLTVVLVTAFHWRMRSVTKFCLSNLAFANLCVSIFCIYQNLSLYLSSNWIFGEFLCKMYHFVNSLSHTASILILVVISVERYMAILYPFKCRQILTSLRRKVIIAAVWILSALLCSPSFYYMALVKYPMSSVPGSKLKFRTICLPVASSYDFNKAEMMQFLVLFLGPLLIITILYSRVALFLRRRERNLQKQNCLESISENGTYSLVERQNSTTIPLQTSGLRNNGTSRTSSIVRSPSSRHRSQSTNVVKLPSAPSSGGSSPSLSLGRVNTLGSCENQGRVGETREGRRIGRVSARPFKALLNHSTMVRIKFSRQSCEDSACGQMFCYTTNITHIPRPHKTVARMLATIVVLFALCHLPYHLRKMYQNYFPDPDLESDLSEMLTPLTFLLMYLNCAINPFLYGFLSKSFRACFFEFVTCNMKKYSLSNHSP